MGRAPPMAARPKHCRATTTGVCNVRRRLSFPMAKVLLFTRTAGPRHASINPKLGFGLNPPLATGRPTTSRRRTRSACLTRKVSPSTIRKTSTPSPISISTSTLR